MCESPKLLLLREDQVTATWSPKFNREISKELDKQITKQWETKCRDNHRLYNQTKFRLHSWVHELQTLHLNLGLTSYRDYVCTNQAPHADAYHECGVKECGNPQQFMADPLAVGAYLETSDNKLVFLKRSSWCGEAPGLLDRPGGHPEPQVLLVDPTDADLESIPSVSLVSEIFSSIVKEIRDEVNVDPQYLEPPLLLAIFRNKSTGGRPIADFYIKCRLSSQEIESLYQSGSQAEADESTEVVFINKSSLLQVPQYDIPFNQFMTPSLKISLPLFQEFVKQVADN